MKKAVKILIYTLTILFIACTSRRDYGALLRQADSLLASQPDSALALLDDIPLDKLETDADSAYYALLMTQARDRNYVPQTDDSLIQAAVRYYDQHSNAAMQARAYYLWGSFYRDQNDYPNAIKKYTTALSYTDKFPTSAELKATLLSNMGYLYYTQNLRSEADSIYHQAELLAELQKDTISLCYAISQQGMINLERGKEYYSTAEQQMMQALSIGKAYSGRVMLTPIYHSLGMLYCHIPKSEYALQYARLNYANLKDTIHCYRTFLLLGNAYLLNCQYDSASIFLQKILKAERYYDTKVDACMLLSEIAQKKGELEKITPLKELQIQYQDSANMNLQDHAILNTVITHERKNNSRLLRQRKSIIYATCAIFLVLCSYGGFHYRKKQLQHKAEKQEWEERLQAEITQANRRKQELAEKEQENATLQERINLLTLKKQTCAGNEYKTSALYIKVTRIAKTLSSVETKENLDEEEWNRFITLTDAGWYGIITYMNEKYALSAEEIKICCLYLAGVPVVHIGHFVNGQVRSTIQLKSKNILQKMEAPKGVLLKNTLFSLAEQLKNDHQGTFQAL